MLLGCWERWSGGRRMLVPGVSCLVFLLLGIVSLLQSSSESAYERMRVVDVQRCSEDLGVITGFGNVLV